MEPSATPGVRWHAEPQRAAAAVLVLHGGQVEGVRPPGRWAPARLRMLPFVAALDRLARDRDVAVGEVVYRCRGWNGPRADAARDALTALERFAADRGPVPVVLVGHSMGGRAALRAAGHPSVAGVVALAPWWPQGEPCEQLAGRAVALVHGAADRVTDPIEARALALRARASGARVCGYSVPGGGHAMLRRAGDWHGAASRLALGVLGLATLPEPAAEALALRGADPRGLELPLPRG
ncbi:dienelactone hydrolase family protein [Streptacidiphilus sp. P02-A3a]|uniref:dienelactone hydrolase family protein n=1 Tax=Streptacidiphilus sp. P02-A3a TaxID=2704468 RepID=UPI0015F8090A|nr:alpha/beta fold hydrolase [Streptacidiphilus sp. P02-A3a]QMU69538.1 alpha/beta fold hydrolase [Streptacidiphilus sp. P02-A3a]